MAAGNTVSENHVLSRTGFDSLVRNWLISGVCLFLLLLLCESSVLAADYALYLPNPVDAPSPPLPGDGVLVKRITIRPGDTLSSLSRQFSGKSMYYPQILLFNKIRNPNLIYAGQELQVPLSGHLFARRQHSPTAGGVSTASVRPRTPSVPSAAHEVRTAEPSRSAERQLYDQAVDLFVQGKFREALDGFTRFLKQYPQSSLVPNASLYRGDCFLRLSEILEPV